MQIAEIQHLLPSSERPAPNCVDCYPVDKANVPAEGITAHADKTLVSVGNEDSDTNLRLGYIAFVLAPRAFFLISIYTSSILQQCFSCRSLEFLASHSTRIYS